MAQFSLISTNCYFPRNTVYSPCNDATCYHHSSDCALLKLAVAREKERERERNGYKKIIISIRFMFFRSCWYESIIKINGQTHLKISHGI